MGICGYVHRVPVNSNTDGEKAKTIKKKGFSYQKKVTIIIAARLSLMKEDRDSLIKQIDFKRLQAERKMKMIRAGIIGATGYAGAELVRLLLQREDVEIVWYGSRSYVGQDFASIYGNVVSLAQEPCKDDDMARLAQIADVIFTATPQGYCASQMTEEILSKAKVIDLSADFRIKDVEVYERWYKLKHPAVSFIEEAVYGLPEINREKIKKARLIANPGCYPTCSFLTLYPMVKEGLVDTATLIIDAKSGASGAGRGAKVANLYGEVNENIKPYGVASHRHTPEIEEQLSYAAGKPVTISFTPHLVPMNRGILVTAYATLSQPVTAEEVKAVYDQYYRNEYFVRVLDAGTVPQTRWVEGSNFADVAFQIDSRTGRIVMMGAIDNMVKGAAGQAVQNMNLMFGLPENTGLRQIALFP